MVAYTYNPSFSGVETRGSGLLHMELKIKLSYTKSFKNNNQTPTRVCISPFSHFRNQVLKRSHNEWFIGGQFKGTVHYRELGWGGRNLRLPITLHLHQEEERDGCWSSACFLLFIQCRIPGHVPHSGQVFSPQLSKPRISLTDMPKGLYLDSARSYHLFSILFACSPDVYFLMNKQRCWGWVIF